MPQRWPSQLSTPCNTLLKNPTCKVPYLKGTQYIFSPDLEGANQNKMMLNHQILPCQDENTQDMMSLSSKWIVMVPSSLFLVQNTDIWVKKVSPKRRHSGMIFLTIQSGTKSFFFKSDLCIYCEDSVEHDFQPL